MKVLPIFNIPGASQKILLTVLILKPKLAEVNISSVLRMACFMLPVN